MAEFNNLKKIRERKALSIDEVALALNIEKEILYSLEKGECKPDTQTLEKLARFYGIRVEDILSQEKKKKASGIRSVYSNDRSLCEPWGNVFHYEYKSAVSVKGIPLVHINLGLGAYCAKGVVAIGNVACGVVSVGGLSLGILSIGLLCIGLIALGILSVGVIALGAVAAGVCAIGGASAGFRAIGGISAQSPYYSLISGRCCAYFKSYKL